MCVIDKIIASASPHADTKLAQSLHKLTIEFKRKE